MTLGILCPGIRGGVGLGDLSYFSTLSSSSHLVAVDKTHLLCRNRQSWVGCPSNASLGVGWVV